MKTILVDAIHTFVIKGEGIDEKMHELLGHYPNRKIIVTNADDEQMKVFGLTDMPFEVFTLKHEPDKIDPEYFRILLTHFDLKTPDVVYFEHNPDAVESARSVGITAHHFDPDKRDLDVLKQFLDAELANNGS